MKQHKAIDLPADPRKAAEWPRTVEEQILLFEWHASHFESLDRSMPAVTNTAHLSPDAISEADWHAIAIRFSAARKFLIEWDSPIRLDRVWRALQTYDPPEPLRGNLEWFLEDGRWKTLRSPLGHVQYLRSKGINHTDEESGIANEQIEPELSADEWLKLFLYGSSMHADMRKTAQLRGRSLIAFELWQRWHAGGEFDAAHQIIETLATVRSSRTTWGLPIGPPWPPIWPEGSGTPAKVGE